MLYSFKHYAYNRVDVMRRGCVFYSLYSQFSCNRRTHLFYIQTYALDFRRIDHVKSNVLCHSSQLTVEAKRTQSAIEHPLFADYLLLQNRYLRIIPMESRPIVSFMYIHIAFACLVRQIMLIIVANSATKIQKIWFCDKISGKMSQILRRFLWACLQGIAFGFVD